MYLYEYLQWSGGGFIAALNGDPTWRQKRWWAIVFYGCVLWVSVLA